MLSTIKYKFNYSFLIRFILINKFGSFFNIHHLPIIKNIKLFFYIKNSVFLDVAESFNFFYFFKFFFGSKAYLSLFQSTLSYGQTYFTYKVELSLIKNDLYFFLFYLVNDIFFLSSSTSIHFGKVLNYKINSIFFSVTDLSIFSDIKTNIGLFDLKTPLFVRCFFMGDLIVVNRMLLSNFKFLYF